MRTIVIILMIFSPSSLFAADLPNLVCQETRKDHISTGTWEGFGESQVKSLYKFVDNQLFLSSPIKEEYRYNSVVETGFRRYQSGYKTIVFIDSNFTVATVTHHDEFSIVVSKLQCTNL